MSVSDGAVLLDLRIEVSREEVRRLLGCPAAGRRLEQVEKTLDHLWFDGISLLRPRGAWRVVDGRAAAAAGMPEAASEVSVGVVTIGPALEDESGRRVAAGDLLDALVLDALGSAAAEAAADELNNAVCVAARERGLFAAPRVSPGYGAWDVACQERLLALLPAAELGIALTAAQMMVPRKSVSFAVNLAASPPAGVSDPPCARCGLTRCRHRTARGEK